MKYNLKSHILHYVWVEKKICNIFIGVFVLTANPHLLSAWIENHQRIHMESVMCLGSLTQATNAKIETTSFRKVAILGLNYKPITTGRMLVPPALSVVNVQ